MKKFIGLFVLMILPAIGLWADDTYYRNTLIDGIYYKLNSEEGRDYALVAPEYYVEGKGGVGYSSGHYSGSLVIPKSVEYDGTTYKVTGIDAAAFNGCKLDKVVIPETVGQINRYVGGVSIENLYISSWKWWCGLIVTSSIARGVGSYEYPYYEKNPLGIAQNVFVSEELCDMTNFTLPDGITDIRPFAFKGCKQMKSLMLSDDVKTIGDYAFDSTGLTTVILTDNVEVIGESSFGNNSLTEIRLGRSLLEMGENSFYSESLAPLKVIIPNLATWCENFSASCFGSMELSLYNGAEEELTELVVPEGVTSVHSKCFSHVKSLKSVVIPNSVETIGESAFSGCENLQDITLGDGVKSIGKLSFSYLGELTQVTLPNSVETIGLGAFRGCDKLKKVTMGDGVKSIGALAFSTYGTSALEEVVLSKALESIGEGAFENCNALQTIEARNEEPWPFDENSNVFPASIYRTATLYVPKGCKDVYARFDGWRNFLKIYEQGEGVVTAVSMVDGSLPSLKSDRRFDLQGRCAADHPHRGIYVKDGRKYMVK